MVLSPQGSRGHRGARPCRARRMACPTRFQGFPISAEPDPLAQVRHPDSRHSGLEEPALSGHGIQVGPAPHPTAGSRPRSQEPEVHHPIPCLRMGKAIRVQKRGEGRATRMGCQTNPAGRMVEPRRPSSTRWWRSGDTRPGTGGIRSQHGPGRAAGPHARARDNARRQVPARRSAHYPGHPARRCGHRLRSQG